MRARVFIPRLWAPARRPGHVDPHSPTDVTTGPPLRLPLTVLSILRFFQLHSIAAEACEHTRIDYVNHCRINYHWSVSQARIRTASLSRRFARTLHLNVALSRVHVQVPLRVDRREFGGSSGSPAQMVRSREDRYRSSPRHGQVNGRRSR
jgi:hypothetical protein